MRETDPLPQSKQAAIVDAPLYSRFSLEGRKEEELRTFFLGGGTVDAWCTECRRPSVFHIANQIPYGGDKKLLFIGIISIEATCGRGGTERYSGCSSQLVVIFLKDNLEVEKIGQYPAAAKLEFGALDDAFDKELDVSRRGELGTAIGLRGYGVGIGSFVYLRRIFESLIEEAHQIAQKEASWDEAKYKSRRIPERIELLRDYLPSRLVENSHLYGIMSSGIHRLSEEDCLESFDLVKAAIELILKERHERKRYDLIIKQASKKAEQIQRKSS